MKSMALVRVTRVTGGRVSRYRYHDNLESFLTIGLRETPLSWLLWRSTEGNDKHRVLCICPCYCTDERDFNMSLRGLALWLVTRTTYRMPFEHAYQTSCFSMLQTNRYVC